MFFCSLEKKAISKCSFFVDVLKVFFLEMNEQTPGCIVSCWVWGFGVMFGVGAKHLDRGKHSLE